MHESPIVHHQSRAVADERGWWLQEYHFADGARVIYYNETRHAECDCVSSRGPCAHERHVERKWREVLY